MNNRENGDHDHWEMFAESMDLSIEGYRLIAEEIGRGAKSLARMATLRWRGLIGIATRRTAPPA
jgi:hypothetical protein